MGLILFWCLVYNWDYVQSEDDEILKKLQTTKDRVAMQAVRGVLQTTQVASMRHTLGSTNRLKFASTL